MPNKKAKDAEVAGLASEEKKDIKESGKTESVSAGKKVVKKKTVKKKAPMKKAGKMDRKPVRTEPKVETKKPITFTDKKTKLVKKGDGSKVAMVVFAVIIVFVIAFVWQQAKQYGEESRDVATGVKNEVTGEVGTIKQKLDQLVDELEKQKEAKEEKVYKEYLNQELGITFKYSEELGDISEEVITQESKDEGEQPKALHITFTGNPDIWLTAATSTYKSEETIIYNGSEENLATKCEEQLVATQDGYCDLIGVVDQQTAEIVHVIKEDDVIENIIKTVPVNLSSSVYAGLTINVALGSPPVKSRNLFAPTDTDQEENAVEEFMRGLIKKEGLSLIVRDNLEEFTTILTSLQVLK